MPHRLLDESTCVRLLKAQTSENEKSKALTDDSCFMYRPGLACVPAGSTGHAPPANGSLGEETVLERAGLAWVEERGHQLFLPLHALSVRQGGSCPHRLDTCNWRYSAACTLTHLPHCLLKQSIQIKQGWARIRANTAGIQRLTWNRNIKEKEKKKKKKMPFYMSPVKSLKYIKNLF